MPKFKVGDLIAWKRDHNYCGLVIATNKNYTKIVFLRYGKQKTDGHIYGDTISFFEEEYDKV